MAKSKYVYLISDGKRISLTTTKPKNLKISQGKWKERFESRIGQAITVYTDIPLVGTIGVYDKTNARHLAQLTEDTINHTLSLAARRIIQRSESVFGDEAALEVGAYRYAPSSGKQREYVCSLEGRLLLTVEEIVNGVCFRGE